MQGHGRYHGLCDIILTLDRDNGVVIKKMKPLLLKIIYYDMPKGEAIDKDRSIASTDE